MANVDIKIRVIDGQAAARVKRIGSAATGTQKKFDRLNVSVKNNVSAFKLLAGGIAAIGFAKLAQGIGGLVSSSVNAAREVETLTTQFEVLTGSAETADRAVRDLQEFAANTPFQFKDLAKAEQRLLSFGFSLEESQESLKVLGDVSAASGTGISELSLIFGQVAAAGKLTGERLLQLQERAIPIGPALAETLGVAESAVKDLVSNGKVDFQTFEKAFESLNDTGSFAFEGMVKRSQTLDGRISTLSDNFELLSANLGEKLAPALKGIVTGVTNFIQSLQQSGGFDSFADFLGNVLPAAVDVALSSFNVIIQTGVLVAKSWKFLQVGANTLAAGLLKSFSTITSAFASVASVFGDNAISKGLRAAEETLEDMASTAFDAAAKTSESILSLSEFAETASSTLTDAKTSVITAIKAEEEAAKTASTSVIQAETVKTEAVVQLTAAQVEARNAAAEAEKKALSELAAARQEVALAEEEQRLFNQEQEILFTDSRLIALEESFTREQEARIQSTINAAQSEVEKQTLINKAVADGTREQIKIEKDKAKALSDLETQRRQASIQATGSLFGALASLSASGGKRLFEITKAFNVAEAITSGFLAVQKTLASVPYPANIAAASAVGIQTAANVARIVSTSAPAFEDGGIVPGQSFQGDKIMARVNSGEMILNDRQQKTLFDMANGGGGGGQTPVINAVFEIDGEAIGRAVSKQVANGLQLGEVQ